MKTQTIGDTSVNEIELSVRAANIINTLGIETIGQLVDKSTTNGQYTGLKGNAKGIKGVGLNYEIATKLLELELIDGVQHLKKPVTQFDAPNQERLKEIGSSCTISLTSSLSDLNWEKDELVHIQRAYFGINEDIPFTRASVLDLIQQYIRIDNQNRLILRTWGYRSELKYNLLFIVEPRLEEWGVLDPKRRNKKVLVRKLSQYEEWEAKNKPVTPPYVPKTLLSHIQSYYYNLHVEDEIEALHRRIITSGSYYILDQIDRLWERIDRMMIPEEVLKNIPLTTPFDELPSTIKEDVLRLADQVNRFKVFFTTALKERLKALVPSSPGVFSSVSVEKALLLLEISHEIDVFFIQSRNSVYNFNCLKKHEELY
jgi:hypothetical protein